MNRILTKNIRTLHQASRGEGGFTLVELMVVIAIMGVLAAIAIPRFSGATDRADAAKVEADMSTMASALEVYRVNHGSYPGSLDLTTNASTANNALLSDDLIARVPLPPHATQPPAGWAAAYTYNTNNDTYSLTVTVPATIGRYISAGHVSNNNTTVTYP